MLFRASESQSTSEQTLITPAILFLFCYCPNLMNLWELWAQFLSCVNPRFKFLSIEQNISTKRTVTSKPLKLPPPLQRKKEKKENINNCNTKMYEIWKVTSWTAVSEFAPLVLILWLKQLWLTCWSFLMWSVMSTQHHLNLYPLNWVSIPLNDVRKYRFCIPLMSKYYCKL